MHGNMNVKYTGKAYLFLYIEKQKYLHSGLEESSYVRVCAFVVFDCKYVRNFEDLPKMEAKGIHLYIRHELKHNF